MKFLEAISLVKKYLKIYFFLLTKKSELYSTLKFSLSILFGADDLQWEMVKDHFPNRIVLNSKKLDHKKILKVAYSPLFDENNLINSIMFVVEDITEIEKLEKEVEEQKKNSTKNIQILQELALNKKEDLSDFFSTTNKMTMDSLFVAKKIEVKSKLQKKLLICLYFLDNCILLKGMHESMD